MKIFVKFSRYRKIEAIKAYRLLTGSGLKEAKDFIDDTYRKGNYSLTVEVSQPQLSSLLKFEWKNLAKIKVLEILAKTKVLEISTIELIELHNMSPHDIVRLRKEGVFDSDKSLLKYANLSEAFNNDDDGDDGA